VFLDAVSEIPAHAVEQLAGTTGLTGLVSAFASSGASHVADRIALNEEGATLHLRRHVLSFFQGNRHLLSDFVAHVIRHVPKSASVIDLYAGVGLFAVGAAVARGAEVTAVEGDRFAAADLAVNAPAGAVTAVHQSVEDFIGRKQRVGPLTIIADPPRTGMSREALDGVLRLRAERVLYVSCDIATLARDARRIADAGYAIQRIDAFDMFPNTPHVETVVVFEKST
jgi:23S rRNA (uracil1939-C5)-methyltransferase